MNTNKTSDKRKYERRSARSKYLPHVGKKQLRKADERFSRSVAPHPEDSKG